MENKTQVLLDGDFFIFPFRLTRYHVKLTRQGITFHELSQKKVFPKHEQNIHFGDVVGCRCKRSKSSSETTAYFAIFAYQFKGKSKRKRYRTEFAFGLDKSTSFEENLKTCQKWRNVIVCLARNINVNINGWLLSIYNLIFFSVRNNVVNK